MKIVFVVLVSLFLVACQSGTSSEVELQNPIIPGYFADPSVVEYEGKYYLYATADPWGGDFLSCWVSDDFQNWTFNKLNWPTKEACTSPLSNDNMVWAPSVVRKGDLFYMYVSVGSEIWAGKASHPLGPWENMLGDGPLVPFDTTRYTHEIDAEAFVDNDGKAYLYWGSGWGWINGRCWVAELNPDMASFASERKEITPERYFEGPWMIKHEGTYYLTYSEGKTIEDSYEVRYATGDSPFGPFTPAANSPVLTKDTGLQVYGPGHHTIVNLQGQHFIVYHKHRLPFESGTAFRQISMNPLYFDAKAKQINTIVPELRVNIPKAGGATSPMVKVYPVTVTASSSAFDYTSPANVADRHYGTLWQPAAGDTLPQLTAVFDEMQLPAMLELRFEYPWKRYFFSVETSEDGAGWKAEADFTTPGAEGSPVSVQLNHPFKYLRIIFTPHSDDTVPALFEVYTVANR
jgi:beta-xylosidase